jgi:hypothetical protein
MEALSVQVGQAERSGDGGYPVEMTVEEGEDAMHTKLIGATAKRLLRLQRYPRETQRRRLAAWLARNGHDWGTIADVLGRVGL